MRNRIRTGVLIAGLSLYTLLGIWFGMSPNEPQPVKTVAPTEAQIKEQVKHESRKRERDLRIRRHVAAARAVFRRNGCNDRYSDLTGRTAYEYGLSPRLLAAVVFVESSCNARAKSGRNSIGLMQINPHVWGHLSQLMDPEFNIRFGAQILASYIHRYGLVEGLHHYNGLGDPDNDYARRVLAAGGIACSK